MAQRLLVLVPLENPWTSLLKTQFTWIPLTATGPRLSLENVPIIESRWPPPLTPLTRPLKLRSWTTLRTPVEKFRTHVPKPVVRRLELPISLVRLNLSAPQNRKLDRWHTVPVGQPGPVPNTLMIPVPAGVRVYLKWWTTITGTTILPHPLSRQALCSPPVTDYTKPILVEMLTGELLYTVLTIPPLVTSPLLALGAPLF